MYRDIITVYNRYNVNGVDHFRSTVIPGVDFNGDTAALIAKYGEQAADNVKLHVKFTIDPESGDKEIETGPFMYVTLNQEGYSGTAGEVAFRSGENFDFFVLGAQEESDYSDNDYIDGFYNHANRTFGKCYAVKRCAEYSVIPHLEIFGG